jgi:hypothetical protein
MLLNSRLVRIGMLPGVVAGPHVGRRRVAAGGGAGALPGEGCGVGGAGALPGEDCGVTTYAYRKP